MAVARTGVYVDDYLEYASTLPADIQRLLSTMRELDERSNIMLTQTREQTRQCLGLPSQSSNKASPEQEETIEKLRKDIECNQENILNLSTEKVLLAKQAQDLVTEPLVRVLRMVDGDGMPMGFIYEAMDRAKEAISHYYGGNKKKYEIIWRIIDRRWTNQLHQPIHAFAYFLNPRFYFSETFRADEEVMAGLVTCIDRMVPDHELRDKVLDELELESHIKRLNEDLFQFAEDLKQEGRIGPDEPAILPPISSREERRKNYFFTPQARKLELKAEREWEKDRDRDFELMPPPGSHRRTIPAPVDVDQPIDPNEPTYCVCHQVSFGDMIACDNENCEGGEWFHYACVGLTSETRFKGKWYCPTCKMLPRKVASDPSI